MLKVMIKKVQFHGVALESKQTHQYHLDIFTSKLTGSTTMPVSGSVVPNLLCSTSGSLGYSSS